MNSLMDVKTKVNQLYECINDKNNVHTQIKQMVTEIKFSMITTEREQN